MSRPGGSDRVREVQRRLIGLGYRPGPVDGLFGPRTRAATRWFQYKHGMALTGRVKPGDARRAAGSQRPQAAARHHHRRSHAPPAQPDARPADATRSAAPAGPQDQAGATWLIAAAAAAGCARTRCGGRLPDPELRRAKPARTAPAPAPARALSPAPASPAPLTGPAAAADTRPPPPRRASSATHSSRTPRTPTPAPRRWRCAAHIGAGRWWRSSTTGATAPGASATGQD